MIPERKWGQPFEPSKLTMTAKFIINSPENLDFIMILGVNEKEYNPKKHNLIAASIYDATAITPVSKLIDSLYKIKLGYVTTLHPWLSYQNIMDGPSSS